MSDEAEKSAPLCQRCQEHPATIRVRRVAEAEEEGIHVCQECASHLGASPDAADSGEVDPLANVLRSLGEPQSASVCPGCGMQYSQFRDTGRLGCAACWEAFSMELDPLLRRLHGKIEHQGRSPERAGTEYERASQVKRLNDELERAVGAEQYERAAQLRDQLRELIGAEGES